MDVIYWIIPLTLIIGVVLAIILILSIKNGQYEDLEGEGYRILDDE